MATFISLVNFTDQGIRSIKESPDRYTAFKAAAEKLGVNIKAAFYTVGHFDAVFVAEGSDEAVTAARQVAAVHGFILDEFQLPVAGANAGHTEVP